MLNFLKVLAVFLGTVIGVGIFGLPYVASKAGFFVVIFYFLFITIITINIQLIYARVCSETKGIHRLPGYVEKYFGKKYKSFTLILSGLALMGALLAYLIIGGSFLSFLLVPYLGGNILIYTLLFFTLGSYLIFKGIKNISQIEIFLLFVFLVILFIFFIKAIPFLNMEYFQTIDLKYFTLPYGVILFSLCGLSIIPELKDMVGKKKKQLKNVIITGTLISSFIYLFFIFIIFGVSGQDTSKEAIIGFVKILSSDIVWLGFIFGIIACFTSFITLGLTMKKILWYDFGLSKNISWFIACFFPLFLYLIGIKEFIDIIGFTGAVAIGAQGIIIVFLYREVLRKKFSQKMNYLYYILPFFLVVGVGLEIFYFIFAR